MNAKQNSIIKHWRYVLLLGAFLLLFIGAAQDGFYQQTIVKITAVENTFTSQKVGVNDQLEDCYEQQITAVVQNGAHKNEKVEFTNEYSYSETDSTQYYRGDKLFVNLSDSSGTLRAAPIYEKRGGMLIIVAGIFLVLIVFFFGRKGIMTLLSVVVNGAFFFLCLPLMRDEDAIQWIWMVEVTAFIVVTLFFVSGFHKKTVGSVISTLLTVAAVTGLYLVVLHNKGDIPYEMQMDAVTDIPMEQVFFISTVIGMLGAVMDTAVTVNATVSELVAASSQLTIRKVTDSIFEIGHDIMGTMVNVLFFSYLSGSFPLIVLKFSNNFTLEAIIENDYVFDIIRFLVGSIGIVAAIPISGAVALLMNYKRLVREQ